MGRDQQKAWARLMIEKNNGKDGIAHPLSAKVLCPYCNSGDTELFSLFGPQLLTVQFYCNTCHTPFECIKDDDILDTYTGSDYTRKDSHP